MNQTSDDDVVPVHVRRHTFEDAWVALSLRKYISQDAEGAGTFNSEGFLAELERLCRDQRIPWKLEECITGAHPERRGPPFDRKAFSELDPDTHRPEAWGGSLRFGIHRDVRSLAASERFFDVLLRDHLGFSKTSYDQWAITHVQYAKDGVRLVIRELGLPGDADASRLPGSSRAGQFHFVASDEKVMDIADALRGLGIGVEVHGVGPGISLDTVCPDGSCWGVSGGQSPLSESWNF